MGFKAQGREFLSGCQVEGLGLLRFVGFNGSNAPELQWLCKCKHSLVCRLVRLVKGLGCKETGYHGHLQVDHM